MPLKYACSRYNINKKSKKKLFIKMQFDVFRDNKAIKIILVVICIILGLYSGFVIGFVSSLAIFKLLEILTRPLEAMWLLLGVLAFFVGAILGIALAILFARIALHRTNLEIWKLNGIRLIAIIFFIAIALHLSIMILK